MRRFAITTALVVLAACGKPPAEGNAEKAKQTPAAPVAVATVAAAKAEWKEGYEATGSVQARTSAAVAAKMMGYARSVRADVGDRVREGEVLVAIETRDIDASISRAQAARQEVVSAVPEAESGIAAAQSQIDLAQVTFGRMQQLHEKRSITDQEFDEASARLKAAQASLNMAKAKRTQLDAKLAQVDEEIRAANIQRSYTDVLAPFSGVILTRNVEPGTLVTPGAPLFTMEREAGFRLEAAVNEARLPSIRVGQSADVTLDGATLGNDRTIRARVVEIVPSVDPASRAGIVKLELPAMTGLRSGLFGRARFDAGSRQVLTVPAAAVVERGQLQSVYVVTDGVAHLRLVTSGSHHDDQVEVLSGLSEQERVVAPAPDGLTDGARVEVRP